MNKFYKCDICGKKVDEKDILMCCGKYQEKYCKDCEESHNEYCKDCYDESHYGDDAVCSKCGISTIRGRLLENGCHECDEDWQ